MKKIFFLFIILSCLQVQSCKKGEEDPKISFRSRTARLTGEWELMKITGTHTVTKVSDNTRLTYTYTFDQSKSRDTLRIETTNGSWKIVDITRFYEVIMTIEKNNALKCAYAEKVTNGTDRYEITGDWAWVKKDKKKDHVNLPALQIMYDKNTTCEVIGLKNDWMKLERDLNDTYTDEFDEEQRVSGSYVFEFEKKL